MPSTPEIEKALADQQAAKKSGQPLAFGKPLPPGSVRPVPPRQGVTTARELVDLETLFGNQAIALDANLRAMLFTLRQLQQARMRIYGAEPEPGPQEQQLLDDLARQAQKVGIGPDGFITNKE